ncbi:MAG: DMT family transporter [Rhodoferax sp.]|jgi:drug/metabolite transporter (DMT)-like permease|nr:DMT family transporter [Rhodoferax sp.]MCL4738253.1 DMT family transporter [Burkholderiaceae bacterium]MCP5290790.1 DMT family transporter [Burkholderiaceae bacterium]
MTHRRAIWTMVAAAMLWSIAGVVTRQVEHARGFELNVWRSGFNALALVLLLGWLRGPAALASQLRAADRRIWLSGACWGVMFTGFMVALTLTTVANVLVTLAIAPLATALVARAALGHRLAPRTWAAIALAGAGIGWMYGSQLSTADAGHWLGTAVALTVPLAAAVNWTLLQRARGPAGGDFMPAVLIGAVLSTLLTLPLALPLAGSGRDIAWLALLGVAQLAVPCLMAVRAARVLSAPEVALLGLLEVIFGVAWAWAGAGETPTPAVLGGGLLVLAALAGHELLALSRRPVPIGR